MKYLVVLFFFGSLIVLFSPLIPPINFWPIGFVTLTIPFVLIANFLLLVLFTIKRKKLAVFPLLILLIGFKYIKETFSIKFTDTTDRPADFTLLSYNTSGFTRPNVYSTVFWPNGDDMMAWIAENDADIKCLQEFYNNDSSENWNSIQKLSLNNTYQSYLSADSVNFTHGRIGIAIFSKFPIVKTGVILISINKFNRATYADVKIKDDTLRVINVHLQSLEIKKAKPSSASTLSDLLNDLVLIYYRLKHGAMERSEQAKTLMNFIEKSPYRVIVSGDFNEMPYCYVYNTFRSKLSNSFEKAGSGFGFTYKGKTLFFLRIDNHFFGDGIEAVDFTTRRDVKLSDHYPLEGRYLIK